MSEEPVRVGFLGASSIGRKTWAAIHKAGLKVTLVGSRSQEASASYIAKCIEGLGIAPEDAPSPATYEEVVTSDKVDVVYISIPVSKRDEWIRKCAANGKHVVSEKPHLSAAALCTYGELLSKERLLFMDGTMFSHGPYIKEVVKRLPEVGEVKRLHSSLTNPFLIAGESPIRADPGLEPMGVLGDLGWYCVRTMLHVMNFQMPTSVIGRIVESAPNGAILTFSGELTFTDKEKKEVVTGSFFSSFKSGKENYVDITGTEKYIRAEFIVAPQTDGTPTTFSVVDHRKKQDGLGFTMEHTEKEITVAGEDGHEQETQMWRDVRDALVREGGALKAKSEDAQLWFKMAYMTQSILDKLLESARARQ